MRYENNHDASLNALDTTVTNLMNKGGVPYGSTFAISAGISAISMPLNQRPALFHYILIIKNINYLPIF